MNNIEEHTDSQNQQITSDTDAQHRVAQFDTHNIPFSSDELQLIQDCMVLLRCDSKSMIDVYDESQSYCDAADQLIKSERERIALADSILRRCRMRFDA